MNHQPSTNPRAQVLALINAAWTTQATAAAVRLDVFESLAACPATGADVAAATGCHAASMLRLLRALTSIELLVEGADGRFALTDRGALLRHGVDGSLASWALLSGTSSWSAWSHLAESVRTGRTARELAHGRAGFEHLAADPEAARVFNRAMLELTQPVAAALLRNASLHRVETIVDVGGGSGHLLAALLAARPAARGVLCDLPHALPLAQEVLAPVAGRSRFAAGSFFDAVADGGDLYLLKSVLHDWNDERCAVLLAQCRRAMGVHAKLFVIERMAPSRYATSAADRDIARSDLNMLVGPGGRERTEAEYGALLRAAGFRCEPAQSLTDVYSLLEARPDARLARDHQQPAATGQLATGESQSGRRAG